MIFDARKTSGIAAVAAYSMTVLFGCAANVPVGDSINEKRQEAPSSDGLDGKPRNWKTAYCANKDKISGYVEQNIIKPRLLGPGAPPRSWEDQSDSYPAGRLSTHIHYTTYDALAAWLSERELFATDIEKARPSILGGLTKKDIPLPIHPNVNPDKIDLREWVLRAGLVSMMWEPVPGTEGKTLATLIVSPEYVGNETAAQNGPVIQMLFEVDKNSRTVERGDLAYFPVEGDFETCLSGPMPPTG